MIQSVEDIETFLSMTLVYQLASDNECKHSERSFSCRHCLIAIAKETLVALERMNFIADKCPTHLGKAAFASGIPP